jgi:hypothetical protein
LGRRRRIGGSEQLARPHPRRFRLRDCRRRVDYQSAAAREAQWTPPPASLARGTTDAGRSRTGRAFRSGPSIAEDRPHVLAKPSDNAAGRDLRPASEPYGVLQTLRWRRQSRANSGLACLFIRTTRHRDSRGLSVRACYFAVVRTLIASLPAAPI